MFSLSLAHFPQFTHWEWHYMVWDIPLASLGQLPWLCPLPASHAPPATSKAGHHEELKSSWLSVSTAQHQGNHQCVVNIVSILNPKHSTVSATGKKITSIPSKTRKYCLKGEFHLAIFFLIKIIKPVWVWLVKISLFMSKDAHEAFLLTARIYSHGSWLV